MIINKSILLYKKKSVHDNLKKKAVFKKKKNNVV
jgi:hypothetical protein